MKAEKPATIESKRQELNQFTSHRFEYIDEQALAGVQGGSDPSANILGHAPSLSRSTSSSSSGGESFHSAVSNTGGHWANNKKIYGFSAGSAAATALITIITTQFQK